MKTHILILILILAAGLLAAEPMVTNVIAGQLGNQVLISYRLANTFELDCVVSVQVSADGGATYTIFPTALSGAVGLQAAPAAGADYEIYWTYADNGIGPGTNYRVKVIADDEAGEVAQPVFDPPEGTYLNPQSVSISCATDGAVIRYTDDGSEPDTNSAEYTGPIEVSTTTTLKTKGFKYGWTPSQTASATLSFMLVYVPGGTFTMGDTHGGGGSDELPTHSVTLDPFQIGIYEVTQAEYALYMQPSTSWTNNFGLGDDYPAYHISWHATLKYCNLRSLAEGLTPVYSISGSTDPADWGTVPPSSNPTWDAASCDWNANGYRLPTEAEWEYSARGAVDPPDYLYSGSNDINAVAWYAGNSGVSSHPVGTKALNELGTYDMSGNLIEWCWDWSGSYSSTPQTNPTGPASGSYRVLRGGAWIVNAGNCRVAIRRYLLPYDRDLDIGFRVCRTVR